MALRLLIDYTRETFYHKRLNMKNKLVMIIDDEEMVRHVLSDLLKDMGLSYECFANGMEAAEWFSSNHEKVDLAVIDFMMPKMNGIETIAELKKVKPDLKAILASGCKNETSEEKFVPPPGTEFINKPFDFPELEAKINTYLRQ
ncbi:MAG: response regulator [Planctomycetota bacterium]